MFSTFCAPEALCLGVLCSCIHKVLMKDSLNTEPRKHKHLKKNKKKSTNFREHRTAAVMTSKYCEVNTARTLRHAIFQTE